MAGGSSSGSGGDAAPPPPLLLPGSVVFVDGGVAEVGAAVVAVLTGSVGAPPDAQRAAAKCLHAVVAHSAGGGVSGRAKRVSLRGLAAFSQVLDDAGALAHAGRAL